MVLAIVVSTTVILSFVWAIFSYVVLTPLNASIKDLKDTITKLREGLERSEERRHNLEVRVEGIDSSVRSAHHRLDDHISMGGIRDDSV